MKITANDGKTYTLPTNPVWHKGPPPETGWWPASYQQTITTIRWYDKKERTWSLPLNPVKNENVAAFYAGFRGPIRDDIMWADRWWLKGGK